MFARRFSSSSAWPNDLTRMIVEILMSANQIGSKAKLGLLNSVDPRYPYPGNIGRPNADHMYEQPRNKACKKLATPLRIKECPTRFMTSDDRFYSIHRAAKSVFDNSMNQENLRSVNCALSLLHQHPDKGAWVSLIRSEPSNYHYGESLNRITFVTNRSRILLAPEMGQIKGALSIMMKRIKLLLVSNGFIAESFDYHDTPGIPFPLELTKLAEHNPKLPESRSEYVLGFIVTSAPFGILKINIDL
ncbi:hypothetical protein ACOME3_006913 [Neoechinorhynchus agilis]